MNINELLSSPNYKSEYNLILNSFIHEYDISKANINALLSRGVIDKSTYDNLYNSDKAIREKTVGLMIRKDPNIYKEIQHGIMDAKYQLITTNFIEPEDIICIKNDAVFVKKKLEYTTFGLMDFKLKNTYTVFAKINRYEFYYYFNSYNGEEKLDVKGISDNKIIIHKEYFMDFLLALFNTLQTDGIISAVNIIQNFSLAYIRKELPIEYYRKFNSESNFDIIHGNEIWSTINATDINLIDIRFNYEILRDLYGLLMSYYFKKVKG